MKMIVANTLTHSFEKKWLKNVFMLRSLSSIVGMLIIYLYCFSLSIMQKNLLILQTSNMNFLLEKKNDCGLSFSHSNNFNEKGKFVNNAYEKKTFSGTYTNLNSFIPESCKTGLIQSLLFWCFIFCSDLVKFYYEINILKWNLHKNSYPPDFAYECIQEFLGRELRTKFVESTLPKRDLITALPYFDKFLL